MMKQEDRHGQIAFFPVVFLFFICLITWGVSPLPAVFAATIEKVPAGSWPVFEDDQDIGRLRDAVLSSIKYYKRFSGEKAFFYGKDSYTAKQLAEGLGRFKTFLENNPSQCELANFIQKNGLLYVHKTNGRQVDVLFTGYYQPEISGSHKPSDHFRYPVYGRPNDMVTVNLSEFNVNADRGTAIGRCEAGKLVPYFSRREIDAGAIEKKAGPIAWTDDPVALFFMHVQGSGRIRLQDGGHINLHYDITNGLPYKSIGRYLIDKNKIAAQDMSMQAIAGYIKKHPEEKKDILHHNPRYVFFKPGKSGPRGCLDVPLTPGRSIALDQKVSPPGSLLFIKSRKPQCSKEGRIEKWVDFSRFAVNQDTGFAIKGPLRADLFWGSGKYAEIAAGHMQHPGKVYFIVVLPE